MHGRWMPRHLRCVNDAWRRELPGRRENGGRAPIDGAMVVVVHQTASVVRGTRCIVRGMTVL